MFVELYEANVYNVDVYSTVELNYWNIAELYFIINL